MFEQMSTTDILILVGMLVFLYMMLYPQLQMHAARRKRLAKIHEFMKCYRAVRSNVEYIM